MSEVSRSIGVLGLGLIGMALARRLHDAGHVLSGFDPTPERSAEFAAMGGQPCDPAQVWDADVVFSAVFDTGQLTDLINDAPKGKTTLVSLSTCDPQEMPALADLAAAKGITLIEAPISGTSGALAKGDVLLLVAGDTGEAARLAPLFDQVSRKHLHVGTIGNGNRAKLAINLVLGLNRAALAEGIVFAEALGLDAGDFLSIAQASAAHSDVMESKGHLMRDRAFAPQGRILQSAKDFTLIRDSAAAVGQGLPFASTYLEMMQDAMVKGEGDLDNSAILLPIARHKPD